MILQHLCSYFDEQLIVTTFKVFFSSFFSSFIYEVVLI